MNTRSTRENSEMTAKKKKRIRTPNLEPSHRTRRTVLKAVEVDAEMVPLVKWLNGFESVFTLFCCQGELRKGKRECPLVDRPYVSFLCLNAAELVQVLLGFNSWPKVEVEWNPYKGSLAYAAVYPDQNALLENIQFLRGTGRLAD